MYYVEIANFHGQWVPQKWANHPATGMFKRKVRNEATKLIEPGHRNLPLDVLRDIYSPDGADRGKAV